MIKQIRVNMFDPASIQDAIDDLYDYKIWLYKKANELARYLADIGLERVRIGYAVALYDEDKAQRDVALSVEERGEGQYAICAYGFDVLLLEFGSGVKYGGSHPLNDELGMGPGTFPGQTHVPVPGYWWYKGEDGRSHYSVGNAPSMAMYLTGQELRMELERLAREVFRT